MYAYEAIQNSLDFIECHLKDSLNAEDIAAETGLSVYYFQHLFSRLIKKTLNEYIKLRRLAKASEILKDKEIRIIDVAVEYGFSDHANFTRAFREAYGITPEEYRSFPVVLNHFIKPDLTLDYKDTEENVPLIADGIVIEIIRMCGKGLGEYIVCCVEAENFEEMIGSAIFKAYSFIGKWIKKHEN
ncbi:MAG TPA: AraC family transcriptional regulator [Petrotogaceae bacterium]|nr:AraC family transcriptional regulator [Petrotogaceae bacterium]HQO13342.1 AraC family transcriptional regulator [Petrotogaceae bacterium]